MLDDAALWRFVVVRGHDEEAVNADVMCLLGQMHGFGRGIRAGTGDDRCVLADGADRNAEELDSLVFRERWGLAGRSGHDDAVGAVLDEVVRERCEAVEIDRAVLAERRHDRGQDLAQHGI